MPARADFVKFADGGFVSDFDFFCLIDCMNDDESFFAGSVTNGKVANDWTKPTKALITGGAGGIGKQTAIEFAKLGIDLYLMDYNGTMLDKTVNEIKKSYPKIKVKCKARV